ncbi:MAG: invasion associated locus B family protein [Hyphomicrobiales bacterium]|nr:invasion associated locus B family protein [Hyphomicrobiales bacterium]
MLALSGLLILPPSGAFAQQTKVPTAPATPLTPPQVAPSQPAPAAPTNSAIRATYGAWQLRCETLPGAQSEQCALVQTVSASDRQNVGLLILAFRTADKKASLLRVIAPLGVLLTSGLGLRIDDVNVGATDFVRCLPNGCVAEARLTDELLGKLKAGKAATFIIFQTPEEGVGVPVSLEGFATGYDALK